MCAYLEPVRTRAVPLRCSIRCLTEIYGSGSSVIKRVVELEADGRASSDFRSLGCGAWICVAGNCTRAHLLHWGVVLRLTDCSRGLNAPGNESGPDVWKQRAYSQTTSVDAPGENKQCADAPWTAVATTARIVATFMVILTALSSRSRGCRR